MFSELKPHLVDLRKRLIISSAFLFVSIMVCFIFWKDILAFIEAPIKSAFSSEIKGGLVQLSPLEGVFSALSVSFLAAIIVSTPVIFWQLWLFIAPGLYKHEKKAILPFVIFGSLSFAIGAAFAYYVIFPFMIKYILLFGNDMFEANISIQSYVSFFMRVIISFGVAFELPILAYFLAKIGLITDESLKGFFRYAVLIIFIIAAVITPPDPFSQLLMAVPLTLLYCLAILIAKLVNPAPKQQKEDE